MRCGNWSARWLWTQPGREIGCCGGAHSRKSRVFEDIEAVLRILPHFCPSSPLPHSSASLGADRTFEQRCVFWCCNGQSTLILDPSPAPREKRESKAILPHCDAVQGLYRTYFLSTLEGHGGRSCDGNGITGAGYRIYNNRSPTATESTR
jgi:hypothetical protein